MSGHNKWSKIKHKKAATDAKKSKLFSRLVREIKVAVKEAGGNASAPAVLAAVDRAKAADMPKDNIERAIKSAQGGEADTLEAVIYELYGPGGVAMLIETITDNRNRTAPEIRKLLGDRGFELAAPGSAMWLFEKQNSDWQPKQTMPLSREDTVALEQLVEAIDEHDDVQSIVTNKEV